MSTERTYRTKISKEAIKKLEFAGLTELEVLKLACEAATERWARECDRADTIGGELPITRRLLDYYYKQANVLSKAINELEGMDG